MPPSLSDYAEVIDSFLGGDLDTASFENGFLRMFKDDRTLRPENEYEILNTLFCWVDAFCPDPTIRGPRDIDQHKLREHARAALDQLREVLGEIDR